MTSAPAAQSSVSVDNGRVRVTTWTFAEGDQTGHHRHEYDYVVVPVTGGSFQVTDPAGAQSTRTQVAGAPYAGTAGAEHNLVNVSGGQAVFVEIELLT